MEKQSVFAAFVAVVIAGSTLAPVSGVASAAVTATVSVGDISLPETDIGVANIKVPFTLTAPAAAPVVVKYSVTAGTASSPTDFKAKNGSLTIKAGAVEAGAPLKINGDAAVEATESINIRITSVAGATVADGTGAVTLVDNDANGVAATPEITAGRPTVRESSAGQRKTIVPVRLSRPGTGVITVSFNDGCGGQNVKFAPGQVSKNVGVRITADSSPSADYTIPTTVTLAAGAATVPATNIGLVVLNDDGTAQPVGSTVRASESSHGDQAQYPIWACAEGPKAMSRDGSLSANGRFVAFDSNATNLVPGDTNGALDVFVKDLWTGAIEKVSIGGDARYDGTDLSSVISPDGRFVLYDRMTRYAWPSPTLFSTDVYIHDRVTHITQRLLPSVNGGPSISESMQASISTDNRYVSFSSTALMAGDTDPCPSDPDSCGSVDVFVLDRTTGAISLASTGPNGEPGFGYFAQISADGRSVAYNGTSGGVHGIWVKDLLTGNLEAVTVNSAEEPMTGWGVGPNRPAISADGRTIAFVAEACNLGAVCPFGVARRSPMRAYVRDRNVGTTTLQSNATNDFPIDVKTQVALSGDGRYVTFNTNDPALIPGWTPACGDHYSLVQRDRTTGVRTRVTSAMTGGCANDDSQLWSAGNATSADGSFVAFTSLGGNIVANDSGDEDVFVTRLR